MKKNIIVYPSLIQRLNTQHQAIRHIISGLNDTRVLIRPLPGKWNIHDQVAHLVRYQQVLSGRLHQMLMEEKPFYTRYKAEEDPDFETWRMMQPDRLIERLNADRITLVDFVKQLSSDELGRTGIHAKYGAMNIVEWTEFFLLHEAHHIFAIFQLAHDTELL